MKQHSFFDVDERLARLSGLGDQLEAFFRAVDLEVFRYDLERALGSGPIDMSGCKGTRRMDDLGNRDIAGCTGIPWDETVYSLGEFRRKASRKSPQ